MADETWISESAAMGILVNDGDFAPNQARIVLGHSLKKDMFGGTYYPMKYIYQRANGNVARVEES